MKTQKQVIQERPELKSLINAVINSVGIDSVEDVNSHGMSAGFGQLVYYADTHKFAMKHRKKIIELLEEQAEQLGVEVVEMVSSFGYFRQRHQQMDNEDRRELYRFLGGGKCEQSSITNLMAWFAAEEVCRMFED